MKNLILLMTVSTCVAACGATAPPTEMPSTTHTTGAPVPADTQVPSDDKPIPPLNLSHPTTNSPSAAMQNTTSTATGETPATTAP